ncbi:MAG: hypothetical protein JJU29_11445 [Verrucomicrobia bacterium]|nr:hypothetical protein [Verrucomicrobiota bacterium]MCH8512850.1 hypothetical protein [Kiritimatiellia bacterium]
MPELAEVETWRRLAEKTALGKTITSVETAEDRIVMDQIPPEEIARNLRGRRILSTHRKGKHMWIRFDQPGDLLLHFGMSGSLNHYRNPAVAPTHEKLVLVLDDGSRLSYRNPRRIGKIRWHEDARLAPPIAALGPDPFLDTISADDLAQQFVRRKRPIKSALLDQSLFAGVGNWIADEVLYQSKIDPHTPCGELGPAQLRSLTAKLHAIIQKAVEVEADETRFPKTWLFHHRWGKQAEYTARGERICFETIGGRTCAWVPERQKKTPPTRRTEELMESNSNST